jgi:hypothetical protein
MSTDALPDGQQCLDCGGSGFRIGRVEARRGGARTCVLECAACALISETLRYRVHPTLIERLSEGPKVLALGAADLYARKLLALKIHIKFKWAVPALRALRKAAGRQADEA